MSAKEAQHDAAQALFQPILGNPGGSSRTDAAGDRSQSRDNSSDFRACAVVPGFVLVRQSYTAIEVDHLSTPAWTTYDRVTKDLGH